MPGELAMRPVTEKEFGDFVRAAEVPFFEEVTDERINRVRSVMRPERTLAVFDTGRIVATAAIEDFDLTVPGGRVPMAGVTDVGVHPTHRRKGLLSAMMRRQLEELSEGGEPLAGLWAAEAPIYGRFGYGSAAPSWQLRLATPRASFRPDVAVEAGVELVPVAEALAGFPAIYERARAQRGGMPSLTPERWRAWLEWDPPGEREGYSRRHLARLGDRGFAVYRAKDHWEDWTPRGKLRIEALVAVDPVAAATLWRFCLDLDLIRNVEVQHCALDDPLPLYLTDPRVVSVVPLDGLWLRLVRLDEVLSARRYALDGALVLEVRDELCPYNEGRWRLDAGTDGASCARSSDAVDLSLSVADLAGCVLGGRRFTQFLTSGRLVEHTPGAALRADLLFATDRAPWCPFVF